MTPPVDVAWVTRMSTWLSRLAAHATAGGVPAVAPRMSDYLMSDN